MNNDLQKAIPIRAELHDLPQEAVLELQQTLRALDYDPGPLDGLMGPRTRAAFSEFRVEFEESNAASLVIDPYHVQNMMDALTNAGRLPNDDIPNDKAGFAKAFARECFRHKLTLRTQIAYGLATVEWETNRTFLPVLEAYWMSEDWRKKNLRYFPHTGRGYCQLTWRSNYQKYSDILGIDLVGQPDLACKRPIALFIAVHGLKNGTFTGKRLDRYVHESKTDFFNARRVVNGLNKASDIAELAQRWLASHTLQQALEYAKG